MVATWRSSRIGLSASKKDTRAFREATVKKHKLKGGLAKELVALGVTPQPKKVYEGPGYQGDKPKVIENGQECSICAESQE
ncbi:MAG: hypothetical protein Q9223_005392, partial [Gallowayella weberi]